MNAKKLTTLVTLIAALISACSPNTSTEQIPVANNENCKPEIIAGIKDKATREEFASKCFLRGEFKPSPKKVW